MFEFAVVQGETVGTLKLDVGYEPDASEHVHQLYLQLV
jgi:hypothetical protein